MGDTMDGSPGFPGGAASLVLSGEEVMCLLGVLLVHGGVPFHRATKSAVTTDQRTLLDGLRCALLRTRSWLYDQGVSPPSADEWLKQHHAITVSSEQFGLVLRMLVELLEEFGPDPQDLPMYSNDAITSVDALKQLQAKLQTAVHIAVSQAGSQPDAAPRRLPPVQARNFRVAHGPVRMPNGVVARAVEADVGSGHLRSVETWHEGSWTCTTDDPSWNEVTRTQPMPEDELQASGIPTDAQPPGYELLGDRDMEPGEGGGVA